MSGDAQSQEEVDSDYSVLGLERPAERQVRTEQPILWPVNQPSLELFLGALSQLRTAGMGAVIGIDYNALEKISGWCGIEINRERFLDIQSMERELISLWGQ